MYKKVKEYIIENHLLEYEDNIIIGLSGGADSVCLTYILYELRDEYNLNLKAVHINHGIRGIDADRDARFSQELCERLDIPIVIKNYDIKKEAKIMKISEEEAGRIIRYKCFRNEMKDGYKIAVAHHKNDQVETILLNMFRGSGLNGLCGMKPYSNEIIRPLLGVTREEIEYYLKENKLEYCIDYTNDIDEYTRNKIRLNLIPYIKENINNNIIENLYNSSLILREDNNIIEEHINSLFYECVKLEENSANIYKEKFNKHSKGIQRRILRKTLSIINENLVNISSKHIDSIIKLNTLQSGKRINLPNSIVASNDYDILSIKKGIDIEFIHKNLYTMEKEFIKKADFDINIQNNYTKCFDYDKIKNNLNLRTFVSGDYISMYKDGGKKKLKDFFIDNKIPRDKRKSIPLVADGSHIMWIVGYKYNKTYGVDENTSNIIKITIHKTGGKI